MKKFANILFFLFTYFSLFSQAPQGFNYQAVVRNMNGTIIASQPVRFKISILKTSMSGTVVYAESHQNSTSAQGISNFVIGNGTQTSGNFSTINWAADSYFLKVELDASRGTIMYRWQRHNWYQCRMRSIQKLPGKVKLILTATVQTKFKICLLHLERYPSAMEIRLSFPIV